MNPDFERYKKLMETWKVNEGLGASAGRDGSDPISPADDAGVKTVTPGPLSSAFQKYLAGTLLCIDEEDLAIYQRTCSDQALDIVLLLMSDGSLKVERMDFSKRRQVEELGLVRPHELKVIKQNGRWTRKIIGFSCRDPKDAERLPTPDGEDNPLVGWTPPAAAAPARPLTPKAVTPVPRAVGTPRPAPTPRPNDTQPMAAPNPRKSRELTPLAPSPEARRHKPSEDGLVRGAQITLTMGGKAWRAVYWGRDLQGHVVAHKSSGHWELIRLDLGSYKRAMQVGELVDDQTMTEIMNTLDTMSGK